MASATALQAIATGLNERQRAYLPAQTDETETLRRADFITMAIPRQRCPSIDRRNR